MTPTRAMPPRPEAERILVIKLSALGDFAQAFAAFAAIRHGHPAAHITLLTTPPYGELARRSPWFDEVWTDGRPASADLAGLWRLARRLRAGRFDFVYDLQTSARSSRYRWFVGRGVAWSGIARGCSHPHTNPRRNEMHTIERQRDQLEAAGLVEFPPPDLSWLDADLSRFGLPDRFVLLIPGAAPTRPAKRWPAERYGELAAMLGLPCVVLGGAAEAPLAAAIRARAPGTVDLTGRTGFADIGALARRAVLAVGNDTGPTHLVAMCGCPTLALFGEDSDPALCAPRGPRVAVLRQVPLAGLEPRQVMAALAGLTAGEEMPPLAGSGAGGSAAPYIRGDSDLGEAVAASTP